MGVLLLIVLTFVGYIIAYNTYGRFLAKRIFNLRKDAPVPSHERKDGIDYVPTRKGIIFGHHYTSIAGTGPIVGPAIGIIWGWVPALLWVFLGSIMMGAVHDFGALVISLRNDGKSIADVVGRYINKRVRTLCFLIVAMVLWIVIAVFGLVIAILFHLYPQSVFPIWMEIPIALALGVMIYKRRAPVGWATLVAVVVMYVTVCLGHYLPFTMPGLFEGTKHAIPATGVWTIVLLVYAYFASTLPVTTLLQPRDYINAWQLFVAMILLVVGAIASASFAGMQLVAPAFNWKPTGAPPIYPFLFITIACGAISGFHSLVASGTSSKQVSNERDALTVGYGSMLTEGALAILVIVAVGAGIGMGYKGLTGVAAWNAHYESWGVAGGLPAKVSAVVVGSANMMSTIGIPVALGMIIMGVFIASFAGTTLDTATRLQRYVITEIATDFKIPIIGSRWVATGIAVVTAGLLAFATGADGKGALTLWPMFGAVNQLLAALALMVITLYLRGKGGAKWLVTAIPCVIMLVVAGSGMVVNERGFITAVMDGSRAGDPTAQNLLLAGVNGISLLLALWMVVEGFLAFLNPKIEERPEPAPATALEEDAFE